MIRPPAKNSGSCEAGPTTETTANTAAWSDDSVFVSGGYPKPYTLMAVKAGGSGDVTRTNLLVEIDQPHAVRALAALYDAGLLYIVDDWGIASCLDVKSGKPLWVHRLDDDFSSSPVKCGNRIYAANEAGQVFVLQSGRSFKLLATNDLGDGIMATPAISGNQILLRTTHKLFCIWQCGSRRRQVVSPRSKSRKTACRHVDRKRVAALRTL